MFKFIFLKEDVQINQRNFMSVIILVGFTVAWFLLFNINLYNIMAKIVGENYWININIILFYGFGAFSAILGSFMNEKMRKKKFLVFWIILGALTTASMAVFEGVIISVFLSILLGFSLGLGFPAITAILSTFTKVFERGRVSGVVIFLALIIMFLSMIMISFVNLDLTLTILFLAGLRLVSIFGLFFDYSEKKIAKQKSWMSVLKNKEFVYYIVPWMLFNIAAGIQGWSGIRGWDPTPELEFYIVVGNIMFLVCAAVFAFISGVIADYYGRKQIIVIGMTLMGLSFTILGIENIPEIIILNDIFAGSAWGFLLTAYTMIPGDLALRSPKEKFYAVGMVFPFIFFLFFSTLPDFISINISPEVAQPFLSIIIFLSIIPILRATETLPKRKIRERDINEHLKMARKFHEESRKK